MPRFVVSIVCLLACAALSRSEEQVLPAPPSEQESWQATGELADLLAKMRSSCERSQKVFEPLSAAQMNWAPPNGTHTPRWNVEHMVAYQLLFFSQIYSAIDPDHHKPIDIRPKQMPADYEAAHADWDGKQEAALMGRVNDYIQGHAYLLEDLDLDAKPPGSGWVLRALLKKMDSHYTEHTANVVKKFELAEWPAE